MDKETQQGGSRNAKETETIPLDLDQYKASSLYLILKHFITTYEIRLHLLSQDSDLSDQARKDMLDLEASIRDDAEELIGEVAEIITELDQPEPKVKIFTKPEW